MFPIPVRHFLGTRQCDTKNMNIAEFFSFCWYAKGTGAPPHYNWSVSWMLMSLHPEVDEAVLIIKGYVSVNVSNLSGQFSSSAQCYDYIKHCSFKSIG